MQEPPLLEAGFLVDMVAAQQLFAFHLPDLCSKRSRSNALFNTIADSARLRGSILSVLGYFPKQEVGSWLARTTSLNPKSHPRTTNAVRSCASTAQVSFAPVKSAVILAAFTATMSSNNRPGAQM